MEFEKYLTFVVLLISGTVQAQHKVRLHQRDVFTYSYFLQTYEMAKSKCVKDQAAMLVVVEDNLIQTNLFNDLKSFPPKGKHYWIGIQKSDSEGWKWVSNTMYQFSNWPTGPDSTRPGKCAAISVENGQWIPMSCNTSLPYICRQKALSKTKDEDLMISDIKLRQQDGAEICSKTNNMHLLHITSNSMQENVEMALQLSNKLDFFIGLKSMGNDSYYWGGQQVLDNSYTNWMMGYPNDTKGNCVITANNNGTWKWKNADCASPTRYFVCQGRMETTTSMKIMTSHADVTSEMGHVTSKTHHITMTTTTVGGGNTKTTSGGKRSNQICPMLLVSVVYVFIASV